VTRPARSAAPADRCETRLRLDAALWRAVTVYRFAALVYALGSFAAHDSGYAHRDAAIVVLAVMTVWTAVMVRSTPPPKWLLGLDLVVALACQQATVLALAHSQVERGDPTLTVSWAAAPVFAWAVRSGWLAGGLAGTAIALGAVAERGGASQATVNSCVLLLLAGTVVGYLVELSRRAESSYAEAVRLQAETAERERLAREVHDGVLQALALVARRSDDPQLVQLAFGQEQALRRLVSGPAMVASGESDLRSLLPVRPGVEVAGPAAPVTLPAAVAVELAAAVAAAVDNALKHGGTTAWLLVEDEPDAVTVSVRDDGPGIPAGRLAAAAADGRLGVASSIRGRVVALGGTVSVVSTPGQGTEVELRVPR
jgi:signal transduction histidine kinase